MNGRRIWAVMSESFWVLLLALVALFAFLLAPPLLSQDVFSYGAYSPGEVVTLTIVMVVLFLVWVAHAIWASRKHTERDPRAIAARERRGF